MILSMSAQAALFLGAAAAGAALGLLYDFFKVLRRVVPHRNLAVQLEDSIYILACIGLMFAFMLDRNYGEIRPFAILGAGLGLVLYFCTAGRIIVPVLVAIINWLISVVRTAFKIIMMPVRFVLRVLRRVLAPPVRKFRKTTSRGVNMTKRRTALGVRNLRKGFRVVFRKV